MALRITPRRLQIFKLREEGKTLQEIGSIFGVSRERIRQILKQYQPLTEYLLLGDSKEGYYKISIPEKGEYYVYFIELLYTLKKGTRKRHIYVGQTGNLKARWSHYLWKNQGAVAKLRDKDGTLRLAYYEKVASRSDALRLEARYKKFDIQRKLEMIKEFWEELKIASTPHTPQ